MPQIHVGKMVPFTLVPEPAGSSIQGAASVAVEAPAEIRHLSADGLSGFVANPSGSGVSVKFTADADGTADGLPDFTIHYEAQIDLLAVDATGFATNIFGDEVDIA